MTQKNINRLIAPQHLSISSVIISRPLKSVLFIKREKEPYLKHYSFAGGSLEHAELLEEGQIRENFEETGLITKPYFSSKKNCFPTNYLTQTLYPPTGVIYLIATGLHEVVENPNSVDIESVLNASRQSENSFVRNLKWTLGKNDTFDEFQFINSQTALMHKDSNGQTDDSLIFEGGEKRVEQEWVRIGSQKYKRILEGKEGKGTTPGCKKCIEFFEMYLDEID